MAVMKRWLLIKDKSLSRTKQNLELRYKWETTYLRLSKCTPKVKCLDSILYRNTDYFVTNFANGRLFYVL